MRMSTSDLSPASSTSADSREKLQHLLSAVREIHDTALQELQAKITKLKKERCLDAQRLGEFHSKNQQLREQQKILQEKSRQLEDRVRSGPCDHCAVTEKQIKKTNTEFEDTHQKNLSVISELEAERKTLKDENRKLSLELERLRKSGSPQNVCSEAEEGMIPDSPLRPLSLPVASKMKRRKEQNHVRYAETPLSLSYPEPRREELSVPFSCNGRDVLVAETCEMDVTCIAEPQTKKHFRTVVPETCRMDVCPEQFDDKDDDDLHTSPHAERNQQPESHDCTNIVTAVQNDESPSVLRCHPLGSREQQPPADDFPHTPSNTSTRVPVKGKRKHKDGRKSEISDSSLDDPDETEIKGMMLASTPTNNRIQNKNRETMVRHSQTATIQDSKKRKCSDQHTPRKSSLQNQNMPFPYDQSWSVDPGADLDQYDTESSPHPETRADIETMDTDCTFVSHSLLLRGQKRMGQSQTTGIGQKANDSLADIFDKTGCGEYESCPQEESFDPKRDGTYEEEREEDDNEEEQVAKFSSNDRKNKSFACVEVVRKKDERRKLKGHYCKECENYYAGLPEEERQKKLSSCSRHRYRYVPPSTPENFWEVGFPSTQTCVERGYIKEDDEPDVRIRRRRPYLAMFSPKAKSQKHQH
uniref:DNA endonuclease RBBP8 n=1 Tax=Sinocyclocheilus grahami TaxID=75366 RepID=A0A672LA16_SINGR